MSTVYSGAGSDEPHLVLTRGNDAKDANGAESRTHDDGLHAAGSRSTLSSNASSSADILYRQTQGNISSPGVILTPTAPTPSPTPGTPSSLSIPGASRMLHQMGGSAGALVGRSRDTTGQRQPTTTAADLWSLSEQIRTSGTSKIFPYFDRFLGSNPTFLFDLNANIFLIIQL